MFDSFDACQTGSNFLPANKYKKKKENTNYFSFNLSSGWIDSGVSNMPHNNFHTREWLFPRKIQCPNGLAIIFMTRQLAVTIWMNMPRKPRKISAAENEFDIVYGKYPNTKWRFAALPKLAPSILQPVVQVHKTHMHDYVCQLVAVGYNTHFSFN